jgi:hypothetical protein
MRRLLLVLLVALASVAARATSCADQAASIWSDIVLPGDRIAALLYRGDGATGVATALAYYDTWCAANRTLPALPAVPPCAYLNASVCVDAVAGVLDAQLRVLDALRLYRNPVVGGTNGCADPLAVPVADEALNFISCPCAAGRECLSAASASDASADSVLFAAVDDPTRLVQVMMWVPVIVTVLVTLGVLVQAGRVVSALETRMPVVAVEEEEEDGDSLVQMKPIRQRPRQYATSTDSPHPFV